MQKQLPSLLLQMNPFLFYVALMEDNFVLVSVKLVFTHIHITTKLIASIIFYTLQQILHFDDATSLPQKHIKFICFPLGASPYVVDVSSLSSGVHTITYNVTVDGVVRGTETQSFIVTEGAVQ